MKNKKILLLTLVLITLVLIVLIIWKINTKDYSKISSTFYVKVLKDYLNSDDENVVITPQSFIDLSSQEKMSNELIEEILDNVNYKNIELIDKDKIDSEQKNIVIKFSNYKIKSISASIYIYYGKQLREIRTYTGTYKNNNWNIKLSHSSYSHNSK